MDELSTEETLAMLKQAARAEGVAEVVARLAAAYLGGGRGYLADEAAAILAEHGIEVGEV